MNTFYEFLDFLNNNSITYSQREVICKSDDESELQAFLAKREEDRDSMPMEDFIDTYVDEVPVLNDIGDITDFEVKLSSGLRLIRDGVHGNQFNIHPDNKAKLLVSLSSSLRTLTFFKTSIEDSFRSQDSSEGTIPSSDENSDNNNSVDQEVGDISDDVADGYIQTHLFSPLLPFIEPKIETITEVCELLQDNGKRAMVKQKRTECIKSKFTASQIIILFHYLNKIGIVSSEVSQTQQSQSISGLTGISEESIRKGFSNYKSFLNDGAGGDFTKVEPAKVKNSLKEIVKNIEEDVKNVK